jgi:hypothetical protein
MNNACYCSDVYVNFEYFRCRKRCFWDTVKEAIVRSLLTPCHLKSQWISHSDQGLSTFTEGRNPRIQRDHPYYTMPAAANICQGSGSLRSRSPGACRGVQTRTQALIRNVEVECGMEMETGSFQDWNRKQKTEDRRHLIKKKAQTNKQGVQKTAHRLKTIIRQLQPAATPAYSGIASFCFVPVIWSTVFHPPSKPDLPDHDR